MPSKEQNRITVAYNGNVGHRHLQDNIRIATKEVAARVIKKGKQKMKKIVLTVVAMMTVATSFAQTVNYRTVRNAERYDMTCDMRRLAVTLGLTLDQMEALKVIQENFNEEMMSAASARGPERRARVRQAVTKDVRQARYVLNDKQYDAYTTLLGTTLRNRGL